MNSVVVAAPQVRTIVRPAFDVSIDLNAPQARAHEALGQRVTLVLPWGRFVGLDWFIRQMWYVHIARHGAERPFRIVHLVHRLPDFKAGHAETIEQEVAGQWAPLGAKIDHVSWTLNFPGGSFVKVMPPDSTATRGMRADMITCSEIDRIDPEAFDRTARPLMSHPFSWRTLLVGGYEHEHGTGLLRRMMREPRAVVLRANYRDVPEVIAINDLAMIRSSTDPDVFRREWECEIDLTDPV